jgi:flagellar basal body-associated protein FliL
MAQEVEKKEAGEHEPQAGSPSSSGRKRLLVIVAVVVLVLGVGAPVGYFLLSKPAPSADEEEVKEADLPAVEEEKSEGAAEHPAHEVEVGEGEELLGAIVPLDAFLVNLSGGKYIRLQVQAELETPDIPRRFYSRVVPMRDQIITLLTEKTATELEEGAGKEKLKAAIKDIMNQHLRREDVRRIYFTQFVIQ